MSVPKVLCVSGASRSESRLNALLRLSADAAVQSGATLRHFNLAEDPLPIMVVGDTAQSQSESVQKCRELAHWADVFLIGTPEYHGAMSGVLKNWFDFLYSELAGKFAAVLCTTGGGTGDLPITAVKTCFQWCHGFVLPFHVAARNTDFDDTGALVDPKVIDRATRIGHDLVRYGSVIREQFVTAQAQSASSVRSGFAGLH